LVFDRPPDSGRTGARTAPAGPAAPTGPAKTSRRRCWICACPFIDGEAYLVPGGDEFAHADCIEDFLSVASGDEL
jgi:hypothetical protein